MKTIIIIKHHNICAVEHLDSSHSLNQTNLQEKRRFCQIVDNNTNIMPIYALEKSSMHSIWRAIFCSILSSDVLNKHHYRTATYFKEQSSKLAEIEISSWVFIFVKLCHNDIESNSLFYSIITIGNMYIPYIHCFLQHVSAYYAIIRYMTFLDPPVLICYDS